MGIIDKLQNKLELYRLERKYARRNARTTFSTGATYVDGEYVYNTNTNTNSSGSPGTLSASSTGNSSRSAAAAATVTSSKSAGTSNKRISTLIGRQ